MRKISVLCAHALQHDVYRRMYTHYIYALLRLMFSASRIVWINKDQINREIEI